MARQRDDGIYVQKPKADVYMALLILTFFSMLVATILMFLEHAALK